MKETGVPVENRCPISSHLQLPHTDTEYEIKIIISFQEVVKETGENHCLTPSQVTGNFLTSPDHLPYWLVVQESEKPRKRVADMKFLVSKTTWNYTRVTSFS